jgi:hypothetical protein
LRKDASSLQCCSNAYRLSLFRTQDEINENSI